MQTIGTVRTWDAERGWGVIDSTETPGGCWAHYSNLAMPGFTMLAAGDRVVLEWERAQQDGFDFRAVRAWPEGSDPYPVPEPTDESGAFSSSGITTRSGCSPSRSGWATATGTTSWPT